MQRPSNCVHILIAPLCISRRFTASIKTILFKIPNACHARVRDRTTRHHHVHMHAQHIDLRDKTTHANIHVSLRPFSRGQRSPRKAPQPQHVLELARVVLSRWAPSLHTSFKSHKLVLSKHQNRQEDKSGTKIRWPVPQKYSIILRRVAGDEVSRSLEFCTSNVSALVTRFGTNHLCLSRF